MAKAEKNIHEIQLEKPKKKGGMLRNLILILVISLLIVLVRQRLKGNGEKKA